MHVDVGLSYQPRAIIVSDHHDERLSLVETLFKTRAERAGIHLRLVHSYREDLTKVVSEFTDGLGAEDVIVAVGSGGSNPGCTAIGWPWWSTQPFGGFATWQEFIPFDTLAIHYQEINVTGSSDGYPWDMARTLGLIAAGAPDPAVHHRTADLEHAPEFLKMVAKTIDGEAVVYPHRKPLPS
jgi:threonine dehydrogenase-like Zn-dependent dehydrogenase